jgi:hypothetical protein
MERRLVTGLALAVFVASGLFLLYKVRSEEQDFLGYQGRTAISTNSIFDPALSPELAIDSDRKTFWKESMPGVQGTCTNETRTAPESDTRPPCLFLLIDAGFSHRPGRPPEPDMPTFLTLEPGPAEYARPRAVRVVFFDQEIVDMDREFRLPTSPVFLAEKSFVLSDGINHLPLDFLPPARVTAVYPGSVRKLWVRVEIESVYPGSKYSNTVGISELFVERKKQ